MNRRTLLQAGSTLSLATIAGCAGQLESLTGPSEDEVKENATTIEYDELYRNISEYEGDAVVYENLRIIGAPSNTDTKKYILMFNSDDGWNDPRTFWGVWDGDPFRENDVVKIWGVVEGLKTYTSLGGENTVPEIDIIDMERVDTE